MVQLEELEKLAQPEDVPKVDKQSLLSKYEIPVQHLEFNYVKECQNGKELEKILHVLRSGEEGHFPDLTATVQKRLAEIKPNSKLLREVCPLLSKHEICTSEWNDLSKDLTDWVEGVNKKDQELDGKKVKTNTQHGMDYEIRKSKQLQTSPISNPKRIASTDYESWDKYDPDTEIFKMDLEDEKLKKQALKDEKEEKSRKVKSVRFNNFATEAEAIFEANSEKERGNECFKAGELHFALQHYTNSLESKPLAVVYTNRALVYNKLNKYNNAIEDCKTALKLDRNNFKAHLRMAQNYEALGQYEEAFESVENAIEINPNELVAQQLAERLGKMSGNRKGVATTRLVIDDVQSTNCVAEEETKMKNNNTGSPKSILKSNDGGKVKKDLPSWPNTKANIAPMPPRNCNKNNNKLDSKIRVKKEKKKDYEVISIPGTSKMPPPYFKVVHSSDPKIIKREKQQIFFRPMLLHMPTIDVATDDESHEEHDELIIRKASAVKTNIEEELDCFQLENFKLHDTIADKHAIMWKNIFNKQEDSPTKFQTEKNNKHDDGGGGEPVIKYQQCPIPTEEELQSPYVFIQTWNSIRKDDTYEQQAELLRKLDFERIQHVIGYKLDEDMLSTIITCLQRHFMVPGEIATLHRALSNLVRIPRFEMLLMFLTPPDKIYIKQLIEFLEQHGQALTINIKDIYYNN